MVDNSWINTREIYIYCATKSLSLSLANQFDFILYLLQYCCIKGSDTSLHESFIREHIMSIAACELSDREHKVLFAIYASWFDSVQIAQDSSTCWYNISD